MPNLIRVIILVAIIWLVYRLIKQWRAQTHSLKKNKQEKIETVVKCDQCGIHIPENEAIADNTGTFCSKAHRDEFNSNQT